MIDDKTDNAELRGHEPTTIGAGGIVIGLASVLGALVVGLLLMAGLKAYFAIADVDEPTVGPAGEPLAPSPGVAQLDADQPGDLRRLRRRERAMLTEYAWVNRDAGVARIPVGRAIEILAQSPGTSEKSNDSGDDE
jgi:hypothetical protein